MIIYLYIYFKVNWLRTLQCSESMKIQLAEAKNNQDKTDLSDFSARTHLAPDISGVKKARSASMMTDDDRSTRSRMMMPISC
jgi:hypothetical protein